MFDQITHGENSWVFTFKSKTWPKFKLIAFSLKIKKKEKRIVWKRVWKRWVLLNAQYIFKRSPLKRFYSVLPFSVHIHYPSSLASSILAKNEWASFFFCRSSPPPTHIHPKIQNFDCCPLLLPSLTLPATFPLVRVFVWKGKSYRHTEKK